MRRILSAILSLAIVFTLFSFLGVMNVAAEVKAISNTSPAITANVGDTVKFSDYSVVFDGDSTATSNLTWTDASGKTITKLDITEKGVVKVTAKSGSKSKTIYVVSKEKDETEYVLFETDFSKYSNISQLKNEGWKFLNSDSVYSFKDGAFNLGSKSDSYARVILPEWLGDFGDYSISTDAKMIETTDTGRWMGVVYRIQNSNGKHYPYYHMCVREATTASGIEFAERTTSDGWNVVLKANGDIVSLKTKYNNFKVTAYGKNVSYDINDSQVMFINDAFFGTSKNSVSAAYYQKGLIGLTMNYGVIAFKNIKVTVQETAPVKEAKKLDLINNAREDVNLINPIANVEIISSLEHLKTTEAGSVYIACDTDYDAFVKTCVERQILATYLVNDEESANAFISAMSAAKCKDANVISEDPSVFKLIRKEINTVRTGLIIDPSDYETYNDIRVAVRSAPATFAVLSCEPAEITKELVMEIQEFAVAVWGVAAPAGSDLDIMQIITAGVNGIISLDAANVANVVNKHLVEHSMTRTPIMIGHRGNPSQAPENTLSGFIKAYENGADVFEVDVEITKDGHIIIMHDSTINRTTTYTGTKSVNQMTLAEIKAESILGNDGKATDEKVPTLKEVCDYFKDKDCKIFVEFKGSNSQNVPATMKLLDEYGMDYLVDVISFSNTFLLQTQANSAGMSTGYLLSGQDNGRTPEDALIALYDYLSRAQSANSTINPASGIMNSAENYFAKAVTDRGITVWPWTYSYSSNQIGFLSGCDGVTTDDVQWAVNMAKYLKAPENTVIAVGQQLASGATVVTYGDREFVADGASTVASVIDGEDCVTVQGGKLIGVKEGTATVVLGYRMTTPTGGVYVTYTQPFEITVENSKAALKSTIDAAKNASASDYLPETFTALTKALEDAEKVYADANASDDAIAKASAALAALVNDIINRTPLSVGMSYTTTTPNRGDGNTYNDDGKRLTDGAKGTQNGATYAGWNNVTVDVIVDFGEIVKTNSYTVYAAYGFWGIQATKEVKVSISTDGKNFTELGTATNYKTGTNGTTEGNATQLIESRLFTKTLNEARYVKFTIERTGNFVWIDEVEATVSSGITEGVVLGDVNGDEVVDKFDYILVKRYVMSTFTFDAAQMTAADVNKDGVVDKFDYILVKRHVMGTYTIGG